MPIFLVRKLRLREANDLSKIPQLVRGSCSQPDHLILDTELLATFKILVHFLCLISYFQLGKGTWIISKRLGNPGRRPWRRGWDWIGPTSPNWVPWNRTVLHKLSLCLWCYFNHRLIQRISSLFLGWVNQRQVPPAKMAERGESVCAHQAGQSWDLRGAGYVYVFRGISASSTS